METNKRNSSLSKFIQEFDSDKLFENITPNQRANQKIAKLIEVKDGKLMYNPASVAQINALVKNLQYDDEQATIDAIIDAHTELGTVAYCIKRKLFTIELYSEGSVGKVYHAVPTDYLIGFLEGRSWFLTKKHSHIINTTQLVSYGGNKMINIPAGCSKFIYKSPFDSYEASARIQANKELVLQMIERTLNDSLKQEIKPQEWHFIVCLIRKEWTGIGRDTCDDYGMIFTNSIDSFNLIQTQVDKYTQCFICSLK